MKKIVIFILPIFFFISCTKEKTSTTVAISFKGENSTLKTSDAGAVVKITDFKLSIRDIEFKIDNSALDSSDIQFEGPYEIDLMSETGALTQSIGSIEVEDGTYKLIRFELHKTRDVATTSNLYDRSLFIKGTINGTPFEFWHDTSENFDIENSGGITVTEGTTDIAISFKMDDFLNSLHTIDLSIATDDDKDGTIEINPDNDDKNGDIADKLKENIKEAADLVKL